MSGAPHHDDVRAQLAAAERGEAAGWVAPRMTPWWVLAYAAWAASFTLGVGYLDAPAWGVWVGVHFAAVLGLSTLERRQTGAAGRGAPPAPLVPSLAVLVAGAFVVSVATLLVSLFVAVWVGALLAAVTTAGVVTVYGRMHAAGVSRIGPGR